MCDVTQFRFWDTFVGFEAGQRVAVRVWPVDTVIPGGLQVEQRLTNAGSAERLEFCSDRSLCDVWWCLALLFFGECIVIRK